MHVRLHVFKQQHQKEIYIASPRLQGTHKKMPKIPISEGKWPSDEAHYNQVLQFKQSHHPS